ncbi:1-acyl-sn-glycerol-3-phosphate acyltransferase [candidate division KSB1 bacterium]|nr:1-acyl-sn-glycerol-3-phosphate acyltransferase [candidate division KSB1 bacterium]
MKFLWLKRLLDRSITVGMWCIALVVFIPLGSLVLLGTFFISPKKLDPFVKFCCRFLIRVLLIRVRIEGLENFSPTQTYLFMSNHVNLLDVFLLTGFIPNMVRGVELEQHFSWPFYGPLIRRLGHIPISHRNPRQALKSLEIAKTALNEGTSILILPEGGRTLTGRFKPFKRGSFLLAQQAGVDLVPMVMIGAFQIMRKGSLRLRPGRVTLRFGPVIPYSTLQSQTMDEILELVHARMLQLFTS